MMEYNFQSLAM